MAATRAASSYRIRDLEAGYALWRNRTQSLLQGVGPVLDAIHGYAVGGANPEGAPPTDAQNMEQRSAAAWANFMEFTRQATRDTARHALAVARSHHPEVQFQRVRLGYALGMTEEGALKL